MTNNTKDIRRVYSLSTADNIQVQKVLNECQEQILHPLLVSYTAKTKVVVSGIAIDNQEIYTAIVLCTPEEEQSYVSPRGLSDLTELIRAENNEKHRVLSITAVTQLYNRN